MATVTQTLHSIHAHRVSAGAVVSSLSNALCNLVVGDDFKTKDYRASNPDGTLTDVGEVIRKLLPKLRQRALRDVKGTVHTWSVEELEQSIHYSKAAIRKAIKALKDRLRPS